MDHPLNTVNATLSAANQNRCNDPALCHNSHARDYQDALSMMEEEEVPGPAELERIVTGGLISARGEWEEERFFILRENAHHYAHFGWLAQHLGDRYYAITREGGNEQMMGARHGGPSMGGGAGQRGRSRGGGNCSMTGPGHYGSRSGRHGQSSFIDDEEDEFSDGAMTDNDW